ncbi:MAG TPA: cupin domain-containing protein [Acidimicrobiales bacterium]|nr:cupin domain-containing protein [Acidimicrobiales bacterium]
MTAPGPLLAQWDQRTATETSWGSASWLVSGATTAGAEQTFGVVTINPGCANPLHLHPNCEEILYVVSGRCEHRVGGQHVTLDPGMCICIPRGTPHCARTIGSERLVVVVSFSSPDREVVNLEGGDIA